MTTMNPRRMNLLQLSTLITHELNAPPTPQKKCKTKHSEESTDVPPCLPAKASDYCLRCLSRNLLARTKQKIPTETFYENALTMWHKRALLRHMTSQPHLYDPQNHIQFATQIYEETKQLRSLERHQREFLSKMKTYVRKNKSA